MRELFKKNFFLIQTLFCLKNSLSSSMPYKAGRILPNLRSGDIFFIFFITILSGEKSPDRRLHHPGSLSYDSTLLSTLFQLLGCLRNDDRVGNEYGKKVIG